MNISKQNGLFSPIALGTTHLKHRVVMAPLTRSRSVQPEGIPGDLMLEYYTQRTSDGGLIIAEAAQMSVATRGWHGAPGMYTDTQVEGWKRVVDAVHSKGGRMFAQLWHPGRFSHVSLTGGAPPVSASVDPEYWQNPSRLISTPHGWIQPSPHRAIEKSEIPCVLELYSGAVKQARAAGFDGVEVHAGYHQTLSARLALCMRRKGNEAGERILRTARSF
jgi:N-ethylmaleimide reductase